MPDAPKISLNDVLPDVYRDLHSIASRALRNEPPDHSFQTTELVHEAYLRLAEVRQIEWNDENQVRRAAIGVVRRVLIDYARAKRSLKRDAAKITVFPETNQFASTTEDAPPVDILALEEVLTKLQQLDARKAEIVELKFFGGQDLASIAQLLDVSPTTVKRDWALARAWLLLQLDSEASDKSGEQLRSK
jgi:RNA polymerase sigma factor (TIGR02999 family)